ncbi:MAG: extracellular solute-binding protein [bacterium]
MIQRQKTILGVFGFLFLAFIVLLVIGLRDPAEQSKTINLTIWGTEDSTRVWNDLITAYQRQNPNAYIKYTQFPEDTYESSLVDALAAGAGPDIFMFHSSWLLKHYRKSAPAPSDMITLSDIQRLFPQVVEEDFVLHVASVDRQGSNIYAMPLYIDTLALLYNKDTFDAKRIAVYPETWQDFKSIVLRVREVSQGKVTQSAAAIGGTTASVSHAPDMIMLLMQQFGADMVDLDKRQALFGAGNAGKDALDFYLQFTNPASTYYTWNNWFKPAIDSFAAKQVAMMFGYSRDLQAIRERNAYLNIGIQHMPQVSSDGAIMNVADYWGLGVSKNTTQYRESWDFITYITKNTEIMRQYTVATGKSPALRYLINDYLAHPTLGVFAEQALTARSWPKVDPAKINTILDTMIQRTLDKSLSSEKAVKQAAEAITQELQSWK